jgi:hypothetical protein
MKSECYLKYYDEPLEKAPLDVLEEAETGTLSAIGDFKAIKDEKAALEAEKDLQKSKNT